MVWLKEKSDQGPLRWLHNGCGNVISLLSYVVCGSHLANALKEEKLICKQFLFVHYCKFVTGPVKTGHVCTNYTCLENGTLLGHCL